MRAVTGWDRIDEQDDKGNDMGWLDESYLPFILDSGCFCYPKVWKMLDNNLQELLLNEEKLAKLTPLQLAMVLNAIARWLVFFKSYLDDGAGPPNSEGGGLQALTYFTKHASCWASRHYIEGGRVFSPVLTQPMANGQLFGSFGSIWRIAYMI